MKKLKDGASYDLIFEGYDLAKRVVFYIKTKKQRPRQLRDNKVERYISGLTSENSQELRVWKESK